MKKMILALTVLWSLNALAALPELTCTSLFQTKDGFSSKGDFYIPHSDSDYSRTTTFNEHSIIIKSNSTNLTLTITRDGFPILNQEINDNTPVLFEDENIIYVLRCDVAV